MEKNPCLSICIVSYNTRDLLRDCLVSLQSYAVRCPYEVIVVDNHSEDGTVEMLRSEFCWVNLICNQDNLGYTVPMNQALRAAHASQYIVQLNPDTVILESTFNNLIVFMESHPSVGICTPKVLNRDGTLQKQCRRSAARPWDTLAYFLHLGMLFPKNKLLNGYLMSYRGEDETHPVEAVSGSCMFIRREVLAQVGYLDEQFFAYQEDSDFCFRARQAGWGIYYVPDSQIIHYGGQGGSMVNIEKSILEWHLSYYRYYHKNLARDYFFLINWGFYSLMFLKMGLALLINRLRRRSYVGSPKP